MELDHNSFQPFWLSIVEGHTGRDRASYFQLVRDNCVDSADYHNNLQPFVGPIAVDMADSNYKAD